VQFLLVEHHPHGVRAHDQTPNPPDTEIFWPVT
jgi:hypothetical protein